MWEKQWRIIIYRVRLGMRRTFCGIEKNTHCVIYVAAYEYYLNITEEIAKKGEKSTKKLFWKYERVILFVKNATWNYNWFINWKKQLFH